MSRRNSALSAVQVTRVTQLAIMELIDAWLCPHESWAELNRTVGFQPTAFARDMSTALHQGLLLGLGLPFATAIASIIQGATQVAPKTGLSIRACHTRTITFITKLDDASCFARGHAI